jgi:L-arabinokinase
VAAIGFYISGHGFGHASRQIEIINAVGAADSAATILVRTSASPRLFDRTVRVPVRLVPGECDTGVVQLDSLHLDALETIRRAAMFHQTLSERARVEAGILRGHDVALVLTDSPPLACAAAAAAGIPSVIVSNFTWDWIYDGYRPEVAQAPGLIDTLREAYALAAAGWRLPMHGGFDTCARLLDVPFVARHARHPRGAVRKASGVPQDARVALLSFGGYGVRGIDLARLDCVGRYVILVTHDGSFEGPVPRGVVLLSEPEIYAAGLRYEDLVAAVDVVISKPGYGIISECVANDTALLYTARGRFAEYDVLVRDMPRFLRCGFIDHPDLFAGRWADALDAVLAAPAPPERPPTNGAEVIARMILDRLQREAEKPTLNGQ